MAAMEEMQTILSITTTLLLNSFPNVCGKNYIAKLAATRGVVQTLRLKNSFGYVELVKVNPTLAYYRALYTTFIHLCFSYQ